MGHTMSKPCSLAMLPRTQGCQQSAEHARPCRIQATEAWDQHLMNVGKCTKYSFRPDAAGWPANRSSYALHGQPGAISSFQQMRMHKHKA